MLIGIILIILALFGKFGFKYWRENTKKANINHFMYIDKVEIIVIFGILWLSLIFLGGN